MSKNNLTKQKRARRRENQKSSRIYNVNAEKVKLDRHTKTSGEFRNLEEARRFAAQCKKEGATGIQIEEMTQITSGDSAMSRYWFWTVGLLGIDFIRLQWDQNTESSTSEEFLTDFFAKTYPDLVHAAESWLDSEGF